MEFARHEEQHGRSFQMKTFLDRMNAIGNIPVSLGLWELTGRPPGRFP